MSALENKLAVDAGLDFGPRGGIRVNDFLLTSDLDIYAVGDAIEVADFVFGGATQVPLAGPANRQGRIAADDIFGRSVRYRGTQGTAIVGLFGRAAAITGQSEKVLRGANRPFRKVYIHPANHAGYYPGAEAMVLKLLFDPTLGRILGGQVVGGAGVDKRIDVLAVAIQAGMSVFDLEEVELAYAPQFGSAKDPINMAGFVAAGLLRGDHPQANLDAVLALPSESRPLLLDVRTAQEFAEGHIPGAVNVPVDGLRSRLSEVPRDREIAVYCQVGQRVSYLATRILQQRPAMRRRTSAEGIRPISCGIRRSSVIVSAFVPCVPLFFKLGVEVFGRTRLLRFAEGLCKSTVCPPSTPNADAAKYDSARR